VLYKRGNMKIARVLAREILDSEGVPTVECEIGLDSGEAVVASVPSGTSCGKFEAYELRDGDAERYDGKGVLKAASNINDILAPLIVGRKPDLLSMDQEFISCDGTQRKTRLGGNAILALSIAVCKAQAKERGLEVYQFISQLTCSRLSMPLPFFNLVQGGAHAAVNIPFQEFMVVMRNASSLHVMLEDVAKISNALKSMMSSKNIVVSGGKEGGVSFELLQCSLGCEREILTMLLEACDRARVSSGEVGFALDCAATQFYDEKHNKYVLRAHSLTSGELISLYEDLVAHYPLVSIEDGLAEQDIAGWQDLTKRLGRQIQLVGDDLFVTNPERIKKGRAESIANTVLIKPNQIGTVSETLEAIKVAHDSGYKIIVSHRSGETLDTFIADLAVGVGASGVKFGAPVRGERVAKYNRLLALEAMIEDSF
jgi:enolase